MQRIRIVAERICVTAPRMLEAETTFFVTVRAVNRSYRFVPRPEVVESLDFALKATAAKFEGKIAIHEFQFLSNHYHLLGTDLGNEDGEACLPDFMCEVHALFSKQLNSLRGIRGSNIEKDYNHVIVDLHTGEKAIEHAVYTLTNAIDAHLVERVSEWKAPHSWALEYGEEVIVQRPACGLWKGKVAHANRESSRRSKRAQHAGKSKVPEVVTFKLVRPPIREDLSDTELRKLIRDKVEAREEELRLERERTGRVVAGWNRVVNKKFTDIPAEKEEYFARRPTLSADNAERRVLAIERRKRFLADYCDALARFIAGVKDVVFPLGTWLMRKRYKVDCAACHPQLAA